MLSAVDLFSGAGGFSLGLARAGFRIQLAADLWPPAASTYRANFPEHPFLEADLSHVPSQRLIADFGIRPSELDLVVGGPPCQGFSIQRIGPESDARNHLVIEFGRFVKDLRPRMFLMENVPGLVGRRGEALAHAFAAMMKDAGYLVSTGVVDASNFQVPQRRRRVLFAGVRADLGLDPFPIPEIGRNAAPSPTVWEAIGDLPSPPEDHSEHPGDPLHRRTRLSQLNLQRIRHVPPGGGFEDIPVHLRAKCHQNGATRIGHRFVYGRMHPEEPAPTITARFDSFTRGKFGHPFDDRSISLREGARLQAFPDDFVFKGTQEETAALIGNAVPPPLAHELAAVALEGLKHGHFPTLSGDGGARKVQLELLSDRVPLDERGS